MTNRRSDDSEGQDSPAGHVFCTRLDTAPGAIRQRTDDTIPDTRASEPLPRRTVWVLAVGCGLAVANLYFAQPLLALLAGEFSVSARQMGLAVTLGQVGYGLGLLFFVPLGDVLERRGLILAMLLAVAAALLAVALAPDFAWFAAASLALGLTTITPQLIVPLAATLARPGERGRVVGAVMSGLLVGVLGSRTFSGLVADRLGWRAVYCIAAVLSVALALTLRLLLPRSEPHGERTNYTRLLASLWTLLREEPVLRQSCLFGAATFGAMSAFWSTVAFFLSGSPYNYGSDEIGLVGLVGVAGALAASASGRLADRLSPRLIIGAGLALMLLADSLLWALGDRLASFIAGVVLLDLGAQAAHIANQTRIYALRPEVRNRLNTAYMVCFFAGGAAGSGLGAYGWSLWGWAGACGAGVLLLAVGLVGFVVTAGKTQQSRRVLGGEAWRTP
jgi:predicted MFS family arabinose efflux permease